jgi:hypothetical protein
VVVVAEAQQGKWLIEESLCHHREATAFIWEPHHGDVLFVKRCPADGKQFPRFIEQFLAPTLESNVFVILSSQTNLVPARFIRLRGNRGLLGTAPSRCPTASRSSDKRWSASSILAEPMPSQLIAPSLRHSIVVAECPSIVFTAATALAWSMRF